MSDEFGFGGLKVCGGAKRRASSYFLINRTFIAACNLQI